MLPSSQKVLKWKDIIEKTLDRMERERINITEYLDELKIKYAIDDEKKEQKENDNDENNSSKNKLNNNQISLLVNMNSTYLCNKGHNMHGSYVKGQCFGCGTSSHDNRKCTSCIKYDENYNVSNIDKTGNKYLWCLKCMLETNKENVKNELQQNELLIAKVTKILNENPQINIDLLCQLKGKTSLEYILKEICIDENIGNYCLYTFDVDGFKQINEEKGHDGADYILKQIGQILNNMEKNIQEEWNVCRVFAFRQGGDEFSVITDSGGKYIYEQEKIYLYLKNEINKLGITISVGMCCAGLGMYRDINRLDTLSKWLHYADKRALYAAKKSGKNTIKTWDNKQNKIVNGYKDF